MVLEELDNLPSLSIRDFPRKDPVKLFDLSELSLSCRLTLTPLLNREIDSIRDASFRHPVRELSPQTHCVAELLLGWRRIAPGERIVGPPGRSIRRPPGRSIRGPPGRSNRSTGCSLRRRWIQRMADALPLEQPLPNGNRYSQPPEQESDVEAWRARYRQQDANHRVEQRCKQRECRDHARNQQHAPCKPPIDDQQETVIAGEPLKPPICSREQQPSTFGERPAHQHYAASAVTQPESGSCNPPRGEQSPRR